MVESAATRRQAKQLGEYVRTWRKLLNLRMDDLCERANISRSTLTRIEQGHPGVSLGAFLEVVRCLGQLNTLTAALDPYETDLGRARADLKLPERVR